MKTCVTMLLGFLLLAAAAASASAGTMSEADFKSTLLYNILQFVRWTQVEGSATNVLRVCSQQSDVPATPLAALSGRTIQGRTVVLHDVRDADDVVRQCDCLWLDRDALDFLDQVALYATRYPLLIVAEGRDAVLRGAAVGVVIEGGRAHLSIGPRATRHAGIDISARLQQLAREHP